MRMHPWLKRHSSQHLRPFRKLALGSLATVCLLISLLNISLVFSPRASLVGENLLRDEPFFPRPSMAVDIMSTGSVNQPELLYMQKRTFGSHPSVRNFFPITELNDTEKECHTDLSEELAYRIASYCGRKMKKYKLLDDIMSLYIPLPLLSKKDNAAGWVCAQKRPIVGLHQVWEKFYAAGNPESLPDYLFIIDDDTFFDMDRVLPYLQSSYPPDQAHGVAGCLIRMKEVDFSLPYGGYGTVLTRRALQYLMRPLNCTVTGDEFLHASVANDRSWMAQVCESLQHNRIGEQALFRPGMSLLELMFAYTMDQAFLQFTSWNDAGYCLHSDTTLSYFLNYYALPMPQAPRASQDRLDSYKNSTWFRGRKTPEYMQHRHECLHKGDERCNGTADICHEVSDRKMGTLFFSVSD